MANVSRPLIALLLGTVLFFALWVIALKPSSSSSSSSGLGQYSSAIQAAHGAVATANAATAAHGGTLPTTPTTAAHAPAPTSTTAASGASAPTTTNAHAAAATATVTVHHAATATATVTVHHAATAGQKAAVRARVAHARAVAVQTASQRYAVVERALHQHKVLAVLFYNPRATDDRDVKAELALIPTVHGAVVTEAIPLAELSRYTTITTQVQVNQSPTLVIIDRAHGASTIVGYTTDFEIGNRIRDALAVPAS